MGAARFWAISLNLARPDRTAGIGRARKNALRRRWLAKPWDGWTRRGKTLAAQWFRDDDAGFGDWCKAHTGGFVVNARSKPARAYLVLHKVGCPTLRDQTGLTGPSYSKLCSESIDQLLVEMGRETDAKAFSKICQKCSPLTKG